MGFFAVVAVFVVLNMFQLTFGSLRATDDAHDIASLFHLQKARSCRDILKRHPYAPSGIYHIKTNLKGLLAVYCEMEAHGGGYTFLPKSAVKQGSELDLSPIYTERDHVLMRFKETAHRRPFTVLKQLGKYKVIPVSVQLNSYAGYTRPKNTAMGAFLYLGFILNNVANTKTIQGVNSEGADITFRNCDKNPNSYMALFPNPNGVAPNSYRPGTYTFQNRILQSSLHVPSYPDMPPHYYFFGEMHFGGCGVYISTNQWLKVNGMAIGMR